MTRLALIAAAGLLSSQTAFASSPDAWAAQAEEVESACIAASGFTRAKLVGGVANFPDDVGYDVVLVRGHYPQPHMKGQIGRMYCLYDRQNKKASVTEAPRPKAR